MKILRFELAVIVGALGAAVLMGQTSGATPGGSGGPPPGGPGRCGDVLVQYLNLTTEQESTLETLRQQTADAIKPIADQGRALRQQIEAAGTAADADPCAVGALEIQALGLKAQIDVLRKSAEATFVASLTAEQKKHYDTFLAINPNCTAVGTGLGPPPPPQD